MKYFKYSRHGKAMYINLDKIKWVFIENESKAIFCSDKGEQVITLGECEMRTLRKKLEML